MRRRYIDNIRWMTVVLVVFYHVIFLYSAIEPELGLGPFRPVQYQDGIGMATPIRRNRGQ